MRLEVAAGGRPRRACRTQAVVDGNGSRHTFAPQRAARDAGVARAGKGAHRQCICVANIFPPSLPACPPACGLRARCPGTKVDLVSAECVATNMWPGLASPGSDLDKHRCHRHLLLPRRRSCWIASRSGSPQNLDQETGFACAAKDGAGGTASRADASLARPLPDACRVAPLLARRARFPDAPGRRSIGPCRSCTAKCISAHPWRSNAAFLQRTPKLAALPPRSSLRHARRDASHVGQAPTVTGAAARSRTHTHRWGVTHPAPSACRAWPKSSTPRRRLPRRSRGATAPGRGPAHIECN